MPVHHNTPENPSSEEPYFAEKTEPLTSAIGTHAVDGSYDLPAESDSGVETNSSEAENDSPTPNA